MATILGFFALILSVTVFPFEKLGLRIKSIGAVEFEQVVNTQAKERVEEVSELRQQILELEKSISRNAITETSPSAEPAGQDELTRVTLEFLERHSRWAFSPSRIVHFGKTQPGFEALGQYSTDDVRHVLQALTRVLAKLGLRLVGRETRCTDGMTSNNRFQGKSPLRGALPLNVGGYAAASPSRMC